VEKLSREELFVMLERRVADPSIARAQDEEIWTRCGVERAIFVSDLSGFTRLTRARGILHFLAVYRRSTMSALPILDRHHGRCVKREADNLIYTFDRVSEALDAARLIVAESIAMDPTLPEDERIKPCIGVGFGRILELSDDVFGDEVNVAFKLGEDLARAREILLSDAALSRLHAEGFEVEADTRDEDIGGVTIRHHVVR